MDKLVTQLAKAALEVQGARGSFERWTRLVRAQHGQAVLASALAEAAQIEARELTIDTDETPDLTNEYRRECERALETVETATRPGEPGHDPRLDAEIEEAAEDDREAAEAEMLRRISTDVEEV
jgi:hypothetical protein